MGTADPSLLKDKKNQIKELIALQVMPFLGATAAFMIMSTKYTYYIISKNLNRIEGKSFW